MRSRNITDRDPYKKAHKSYDELHDLLGNLAGKLTEVSKDVDKEFLASYRVHMLSIQTEIKTLREDVDKGVQALKSDGNVAKLELEVNWFVATLRDILCAVSKYPSTRSVVLSVRWTQQQICKVPN